MEIKIYDNSFSHVNYSSLQNSDFFKWVRTNEIRNIAFFTDNLLYLANNVNDKIKIAWLLEPRAIAQHNYDFIEKNHNLFDYVLTYDVDLLSISDKFIFYPHGGCWIDKEDQKIHEKNKMVSIILSAKKITTGHRFRHEIIENTKNVDIYGFMNPIQNKITALKDYAFSIIIENSKTDYYFTEKLIDCFITGTVPIYWGCPSIGDFFDVNGMIIVDDLNHLQNELETLSFEKYKSMESAILKNFEKSKEFILAEDWIFKNTKLMQL